MMSCADLRAAFERLIRYMLILSDALDDDDERRAGGYRITFVLFGGDRPIPRQRIEFIFVTRDRLLPLDQSARYLSPRAVEFAYPAPADLAPYRAAFRCPVSFDAARHSTCYSRVPT